MVPADQIGRPGGRPCRRHDRVDVEVVKRFVDAVDPGQPVDVERLVVRHAAEARLWRIPAAHVDRFGQVEDFLCEKRHLDCRVRVVESNGIGQRSAGHRHADSRREVGL